MGRIWLTSDLHFGHDREFIYAPRGYKSVWDMNGSLIENWNKVVADDDTVYILGDLMLGDNHEGMRCLNQLKGEKVVITGNHDTAIRKELYVERLRGFAGLFDATTLKYDKYNFFLCHYPTMTSNFDDDKPLRQRLICLCGHTHTKDKFLDWKQSPIYHVEVDAHDNYPVSLDQIILDMKEKVKA